MNVCLQEWDVVFSGKSQKERGNLVESFTVASKKNPSVPYDFGADFYKFPSYLRRAAIAEALGKVSSYRSNLARWEPPIRLFVERNRDCRRQGSFIRPCTGGNWVKLPLFFIIFNANLACKYQNYLSFMQTHCIINLIDSCI